MIKLATRLHVVTPSIADYAVSNVLLYLDVQFG